MSELEEESVVMEFKCLKKLRLQMAPFSKVQKSVRSSVFATKSSTITIDI